jgi:DNA-binding cell septation regulator SpoVG
MMKILQIDVRLTMLAGTTADGVLAYADVTFGHEGDGNGTPGRAVCVREFRVLQGRAGQWVAFPSRAVRAACSSRGCGRKIAVVYRYCPWCASEQPPLRGNGAQRFPASADGNFYDAAFPSDQGACDWVGSVVMEEFRAACKQDAWVGLKDSTHAV